MPVERCQDKGRPGFRWGKQKCYTYRPGDKKGNKAAYEKAALQGRAIKRAGGGMLQTSVIRKFFGAEIEGADIDGLISSELESHRAALENAKAAHDAGALSRIVEQILARMRTQIELSYTQDGTLMAALSEEDRKFREQVVDSIVTAPWFDEDFDLMTMLFALLRQVGQELLKRLGLRIKKAIAPDLRIKVRRIIEGYVGRSVSGWVVEQVTSEIERTTTIDWAQLSDEELDRLVVQACNGLGIVIGAPETPRVMEQSALEAEE